VPEFSPFAGIRYDCRSAGTTLDALAAPPYDVVDDDLHAALEARSPNNAVRLILPLDAEREGDRYERAATTFAEWLAQGILFADAEPRFYAYRMTFTDPHGRSRHTRGVLGALRLPEGHGEGDGEGGDDILPHERTLPKAKSDRLALLRAMRVNVDPIWGLSLASGLTDQLRHAVPLAECHDSDGVFHELGAIDDPAVIAEISRLVGSTPVVLADGHHRFETALNYRKERRAAGVDDPGADAILTLVVELVDDELCIEPIHRLVDLPAGSDLRSQLADAFTIRELGPITPDGIDALVTAMHAEGALGLADAQGLALAIPDAHQREVALAGEHAAVAATDAAVVETMVVPRLPGASWNYRADAQAVCALAEKGVHTAAILCSPVSVAETRWAAVDRVRMPQKTTFFWPKPRTGMVFRTLD
jgi:uncharacterized protein (DUF1015 family)